jgi:hypothetical protein
MESQENNSNSQEVVEAMKKRKANPRKRPE